jgi:3-dehydroquinate dehydratase
MTFEVVVLLANRTANTVGDAAAVDTEAEAEGVEVRVDILEVKVLQHIAVG